MIVATILIEGAVEVSVVNVDDLVAATFAASVIFVLVAVDVEVAGVVEVEVEAVLYVEVAIRFAITPAIASEMRVKVPYSPGEAEVAVVLEVVVEVEVEFCSDVANCVCVITW